MTVDCFNYCKQCKHGCEFAFLSILTELLVRATTDAHGKH